MALWHGVAAPAANVSGILKQVPGELDMAILGEGVKLRETFPRPLL